MALWVCKKCGQYNDDLYNTDEICEDCFDKMKREEKKQKRRNTPFFRILSFALAISLMLCIFSGFGVAHADDDYSAFAQHTLYTYKDYAAFKWTTDSVIQLSKLYEFHRLCYSGTTKLYYYLIYFDETGKTHYYSSSVNSTFIAQSLYRPDNYNFAVFEFMGKTYYDGSLALSDSQLKSNSSAFKLGTLQDINPNNTATTPATIVTYTGNYADDSAALGTYVVHDGSNANIPLFSDGVEYYLVACPYLEEQGANTDTFYKNLFIDNASSSDLGKSKEIDFSAKFHSFSSLNDGETGLNMIDWLGMGKQYPLADFSINDNGNNHSYSLRISTNNKYVDTCMNMWQDYRNNHITSTAGNVVGVLATIRTLLTGAGATAYGPLGLFLITVPMENGTVEALRKIAQRQLLENIDNLSYVVEYNLTNSDLQFNEGESTSRAYSVCLVDYLTITKGLVYRLDIVDNYTGFILDTAYFCNDTTFAKTETGYGTKVYNYTSYDDLVNDIEKGNNYSGADNFSQSDTLHSDNASDIVDWNKYNQYDFTNIQNLTGTLNSATAGLGSFFIACYNIVPPVFVSILLGTFTLVIILRVLGR